MLSSWSSSEIISFYRAAPYLNFSRALQRLYLAYENLIASRSIETLATHYLIIARA